MTELEIKQAIARAQISDAPLHVREKRIAELEAMLPDHSSQSMAKAQLVASAADMDDLGGH